jgi:hypothetical protein
MNNTIIAWDLGATKCAAGLLQCDNNGELHCSKTFTVKLSETSSLIELIERIEIGLDIKFSET